MGIAYNPRVVTDGLVLALDAGNNKSHSTNRFISYGSGLVTEGIGFQVNGSGTFQRVAAGTVIGGYTVKTTDVVYSYALGSDGCHYHGNDVSIPAGVYATFSFDYLVTGATNYPSTDYLANFENAFSNSIGTANNLQNVWQRRTFTSGPTGSAGTLRMLLYPGACGGRLADSGTLYFRNPKVEWTNVDTGDGNFSSMSNVTTWYDMSGNGNNGTLTNGPTYSNNIISLDATDDTISFPFDLNYIPALSNFSMEIWMRIDTFPTPTASANQYGNYQRAGVLFGSMYYGGVAFYWTGNSTGTSMNVYPVIRGQDAYRNATLISINLNTWYNLVLVNNYSSSKFQFYVNGSLYSEVTGPTQEYNPSFVSVAGNIGISKPQVDGGGTLNYSYLDCDVAVAKIYKNKALTAAEISQNFNATRARFGI